LSEFHIVTQFHFRAAQFLLEMVAAARIAVRLQHRLTMLFRAVEAEGTTGKMLFRLATNAIIKKLIVHSKKLAGAFAPFLANQSAQLGEFWEQVVLMSVG
jgi:hypothetical protein